MTIEKKYKTVDDLLGMVARGLLEDDVNSKTGWQALSEQIRAAIAEIQADAFDKGHAVGYLEAQIKKEPQ